MIREYVVTIDDPVSGLWTEDIPDAAGVYFVFSAKERVNLRQERVFALQTLLYIGRSIDVNKRINGQHHRHADIVNSCAEGEVPCYYYGRIDRADGAQCLEGDYIRVEAALIYGKKPLLNETANREFHHDLTLVTLRRCQNTLNCDSTTGIAKALPIAFGSTLILAM